MKKEFITFEGFDFNEVETSKIDYVLPGEFAKMIGEEGLDLEEDLFYFGEFVRYITKKKFNNKAVVLKNDELETVYLNYYNYCCRLDRECYRLMYLPENENRGFFDFLGFHPGRLFGKTVDGGNYEIFKFLYESYYINMHYLAVLGLEEKDYINTENGQ